MEKKELEIIKQLMDQLSEQMEYGEEDLSERLGRKKPEVEVVKIEASEPMEIEEEDEEELPEEMEMMLEDEEDSSPEDELKRRLLKLRG